MRRQRGREGGREGGRVAELSLPLKRCFLFSLGMTSMTAGLRGLHTAAPQSLRRADVTAHGHNAPVSTENFGFFLEQYSSGSGRWGHGNM